MQIVIENREIGAPSMNSVQRCAVPQPILKSIVWTRPKCTQTLTYYLQSDSGEPTRISFKNNNDTKKMLL